ncbi:MAG: site-2 protease family protein [Pseudomonadota bacterium]
MTSLALIAVIGVPAILAISLHEVAHGAVALKLGDRTAAERGRLSLNPIKHVDPIGSIAVPAALFFLGKILFGHPLYFGWAKPVPVVWRHLNPRRLGIGLVAIAGPMANLLMLLIWFAFAFLLSFTSQAPLFLLVMCEAGIMFNATLMLINLIPVPPLDGSRVVTAMLPVQWALRYNKIEPYGLFVLLLLLTTGGLQWLFGGVIGVLLDALPA